MPVPSFSFDPGSSLGPLGTLVLPAEAFVLLPLRGPRLRLDPMTTSDRARSPLELSREECDALLASTSVGRVAYTDRALPQVIPVNYAVDGTSIVFRTAHDSRLAACCRNAVIAFEVDDIDPVARGGWSVLVVGDASPVTDESELVRARQLPFAPWAGGRRDSYIRITPGFVTGRAIPALAPAQQAS